MYMYNISISLFIKKKTVSFRCFNKMHLYVANNPNKFIKIKLTILLIEIFKE